MAGGLNEVIQIKGLQISWTSKRAQQIDRSGISTQLLLKGKHTFLNFSDTLDSGMDWDFNEEN